MIDGIRAARAIRGVLAVGYLLAAARVLAVAWGQGAASLLGAGLLVAALVMLAAGHLRQSLIAAKVSAAQGGVILMMMVPALLVAYGMLDLPGTGWTLRHAALPVACAVLALVHYAMSRRHAHGVAANAPGDVGTSGRPS